MKLELDFSKAGNWVKGHILNIIGITLPITLTAIPLTFTKFMEIFVVTNKASPEWYWGSCGIMCFVGCICSTIYIGKKYFDWDFR